MTDGIKTKMNVSYGAGSIPPAHEPRKPVTLPPSCLPPSCLLPSCLPPSCLPPSCLPPSYLPPSCLPPSCLPSSASRPSGQLKKPAVKPRRKSATPRMATQVHPSGGSADFGHQGNCRVCVCVCMCVCVCVCVCVWNCVITHPLILWHTLAHTEGSVRMEINVSYGLDCRDIGPGSSVRDTQQDM